MPSPVYVYGMGKPPWIKITDEEKNAWREWAERGAGGFVAASITEASPDPPTPGPAETYPLDVDRLTLSMDFEEFCQWRLRRQVDRLVEAYTNQDLEVSELEAGFQRERGQIERLTEAFYKAIGVKD